MHQPAGGEFDCLTAAKRVLEDGTMATPSATRRSGPKIGTVAGSPESTVLLSDYNVDPDAEREFPEQFALIDTVAEKIIVVPMPEGVGLVAPELSSSGWDGCRAVTT